MSLAAPFQSVLGEFSRNRVLHLFFASPSKLSNAQRLLLSEFCS